MANSIRVAAFVGAGRGNPKGASYVAAFDARMKPLASAVKTARSEAADRANEVSKRLAVRRGPKEAPRPGRDYASIRDTIHWGLSAQGLGVQVNIAELNAKAPQWIIQEIGTGHTAQAMLPNVSRGAGRPSNKTPGRYKIAKQAGRPIWVIHTVDGPSVRNAKTKAALKRRVGRRKKDIPFGNAVIGREIAPKHFIREGAKEGYSVYRNTILGAARRSFKK